MDFVFCQYFLLNKFYYLVLILITIVKIYRKKSISRDLVHRNQTEYILPNSLAFALISLVLLHESSK